MKKTIYIVTVTEWDDVTGDPGCDTINLAACETKEIAINYIKNLNLEDIQGLPCWGVDEETTTEEETKDGIRSFSSEDGHVEITVGYEEMDLMTEG